MNRNVLFIGCICIANAINGMGTNDIDIDTSKYESPSFNVLKSYEASRESLKNTVISKLLDLKKDAESTKDLNKTIMHFELWKAIAAASKRHYKNTNKIELNYDLTTQQLNCAPEGFVLNKDNEYYLTPSIASIFGLPDTIESDSDNE